MSDHERITVTIPYWGVPHETIIRRSIVPDDVEPSGGLNMSHIKASLTEAQVTKAPIPCLMHPRWMQLVITGQKTVDARLARVHWQKVVVGDLLRVEPTAVDDIHPELQQLQERKQETNKELVNDASCPFHMSVTRVTQYPTFQVLLEQEGLRHVLPGVETLSAALDIYGKIYTKGQESEFGVVAIGVKFVGFC